jgi:glycine cleavage system H protein
VLERRYTKSGEWVAFDGTGWRVGLSAAAADELGDITFVELPVLGRRVGAGEAVCSIEAVKAAADYYSPVDGRIAAVNSVLAHQPELINADPEDEGWIFALEDVPAKSFQALMDETAWKTWETGR